MTQQALVQGPAKLFTWAIEPIGQKEKTEHHVHDDEDVSCLHVVFLKWLKFILNLEAMAAWPSASK